MIQRIIQSIKFDAKGIPKRIIDIGKKCLLYGVKEVIITSVVIKRPFKLILESSGESVISYAMNVLVTTTSPTNGYKKMDYT